MRPGRIRDSSNSARSPPNSLVLITNLIPGRSGAESPEKDAEWQRIAEPVRLPATACSHRRSRRKLHSGCWYCRCAVRGVCRVQRPGCHERRSGLCASRYCPFRENHRAARPLQNRCRCHQSRRERRSEGGEGSRTVFRDAQRIAQQYGGNAADWFKKTSSSYLSRDGNRFEIHWVENIRIGQRVEFKTKFPGSE